MVLEYVDTGLMLAGGGTVGALALARWCYRAYALAKFARTLALIFALFGVGAAAGVVDVGRLLELIRLGLEVVR